MSTAFYSPSPEYPAIYCRELYSKRERIKNCARKNFQRGIIEKD
jgi:hypothetical protein